MQRAWAYNQRSIHSHRLSHAWKCWAHTHCAVISTRLTYLCWKLMCFVFYSLFRSRPLLNSFKSECRVHVYWFEIEWKDSVLNEYCFLHIDALTFAQRNEYIFVACVFITVRLLIHFWMCGSFNRNFYNSPDHKFCVIETNRHWNALYDGWFAAVFIYLKSREI